MFSLKNVPEAEANAIRRLLAQAKIKFYETPSTLITDGAIWVYEETDIANAIELIDKYEIEWQRKNKNPEPLSTQKRWQEITLITIVWAMVAVALMFVFSTFNDP
ncbi:MAG: DUF6164 family protein [Candidatus Thiodiazotropha sp.]